ncbi:hypothetical protein KC19_2G097000 [Ceratodon purpureus]|uniref:Uncharacterized protein n=1 Tax=Ceratodon purpureus TaxID=3225 RepID=A0A8T0ITQ2_CERPU|nr:hypothetical protein KC19_2G097000 [Ceratodon purpureus]
MVLEQWCAGAKIADFLLMVRDAFKTYFKRERMKEYAFFSFMQLIHVNDNLYYQILHEFIMHNAAVDFNDIACLLTLVLIL